MTDIIEMGGTATLLTITETQGIGAIAGAINGAAVGGPRGEARDIGNGALELSLYHWFLDRDGSSLYTHDREILRYDEGSETYLMEVWYTVVGATGRFEGYRGTFRSRGWIKSEIVDGVVKGRSRGTVRFEGQLVRD